jgi:hypothetical protein
MLKVFKSLFLGFFLISLISCGSSRSKVITTKSEENRSERYSRQGNSEIEPANGKVYNIISNAKRFEGEVWIAPDLFTPHF